MARYRRSTYRNYSYGYTKPTGIYMAEKHIEAFRKLENELGGSIHDVKQYLYSLSDEELIPIFDQYEYIVSLEKQKKKDGSLSARLYAEKTLKKWKSGEVEMSGIVAERFFKILPIFMPLDIKYKLIESLYNHLEEQSPDELIKNFYIGYDVDIKQLQKEINNFFEESLISKIQHQSLENRFNWLSQNDSILKLQLINYFNELKKNILLEELEPTLKILLSKIHSSNGKYVSELEHSITIRKKTAKVIFHKKVTGIMYEKPKSFFERIFS